MGLRLRDGEPLDARVFSSSASRRRSKFVRSFLAPWFLLAAWRAMPVAPRGPKLVLAARALALTTLPILASYAVFWRGAETLAGLSSRSQHGLHPTGGSFVQGLAIVLALWGALTPWVARAPLARAARGWVLVSLAVVMLLTGMRFPWYFIWPWADCARAPRAHEPSVHGDRGGRGAVEACGATCANGREARR